MVGKGAITVPMKLAEEREIAGKNVNGERRTVA
jgi:hypothetical protein